MFKYIAKAWSWIKMGKQTWLYRYRYDSTYGGWVIETCTDALLVWSTIHMIENNRPTVAVFANYADAQQYTQAAGFDYVYALEESQAQQMAKAVPNVLVGYQGTLTQRVPSSSPTVSNIPQHNIARQGVRAHATT